MLFGDGDGVVAVDGVVAFVEDGDTPCSGRYCCCASSRCSSWRLAVDGGSTDGSTLPLM